MSDTPETDACRRDRQQLREAAQRCEQVMAYLEKNFQENGIKLSPPFTDALTAIREALAKP